MALKKRSFPAESGNVDTDAICCRYLVEILVSSGSYSKSSIQVGVRRSNSPYNAAQTGWGQDEVQTITTSSSVQPEIQVA